LKATVERYLEGRRLHLGNSAIDQERRYLARFVASMAAQGVTELRSVELEHLARYRAELGTLTNRLGAPVSDAFLRKAVSAVRCFLVWAQRSGLLLWSFASLPLPKVAVKLRYVPTVEEMRRLLAMPDLDQPMGLRDRLLLELLYVLGLRIGETVALDLESADLAARTLVVVGKGGHQRLLPLSPGLFQTVLDYLSEGRPRLAIGGEEKALLLGANTGKRPGKQSMLLRVRGYGARLGLALSPHLLRYACATHLVEGGAELPYVARLLGHECLKSTRRYARIRPVELCREHRRCHPRAMGGHRD
jgi:site-specific recombinase XerD